MGRTTNQAEAAKRTVTFAVSEPWSNYTWSVNCTYEQARAIEASFKRWYDEVMDLLDQPHGE